MTNDSRICHRILFVCHGNICRSPMAEFVMKHKVSEMGLADRFEIASAATSTEELGNPVYPPARRMLASHGIGCQGKTARQIVPSDYRYYDLLIGMDRYNLANMRRAFRGDPEGRVRPLLPDRDVADPWYTDDFDATWNDVNEGCDLLLRELGY